MTLLQAIVLGLVQGLTEFLPVSSSAHLLLTPWVFGWTDPGLAFDVALHIGTLLAVAWYFRRDWAAMARAALRMLSTRRLADAESRRILYLVVATIPAIAGGILLESYAETVFRAPWVPATTLIVLGVVLWLVDRRARADRPLAEMRSGDAWLIGLAQVLALVPGVSRSGSTMTAGRALGFDRRSAAAFSFLMSMPVTLGAIVLKAPDAVRAAESWTPLAAGILASAVSGWLAISVLLRWLARHSFGVFAVYRVALGVLILVLLGTRG